MAAPVTTSTRGTGSSTRARRCARCSGLGAAPGSVGRLAAPARAPGRCTPPARVEREHGRETSPPTTAMPSAGGCPAPPPSDERDRQDAEEVDARSSGSGAGAAPRPRAPPRERVAGARRRWLANSTIRMPFFVTRPISMISADLAEDVERLPEAPERHQRAGDRERHGEHDDRTGRGSSRTAPPAPGRSAPARARRRRADSRPTSREVARLAREAGADSGGSSRRRDLVAGRRCRRPASCPARAPRRDRGRREAVEAVDRGGPTVSSTLHQVVERDHARRPRRAHEEAREVARVVAVVALDLADHVVLAAVQQEVAEALAAEGELQRARRRRAPRRRARRARSRSMRHRSSGRLNLGRVDEAQHRARARRVEELAAARRRARRASGACSTYCDRLRRPRRSPIVGGCAGSARTAVNALELARRAAADDLLLRALRARSRIVRKSRRARC